MNLPVIFYFNTLLLLLFLFFADVGWLPCVGGHCWHHRHLEHDVSQPGYSQLFQSSLCLPQQLARHRHISIHHDRLRESRRQLSGGTGDQRQRRAAFRISHRLIHSPGLCRCYSYSAFHGQSSCQSSGTVVEYGCRRCQFC